MLFNQHSGLADRHAFLSPSQYHWLNYDEQKLEARFHTVVSSRKGVDIHKLAHESIRLGVPLHRSNKALAHYVADGVKYRMACEQPLYYSDNCYGTCDTISFSRKTLRIHDLKTGIVKASMHQLEIYAAIFCLEYHVNPYDINIVLRIYQRENIEEFIPPPELIESIMEKIVYFDRQIEEIKEALW